MAKPSGRHARPRIGTLLTEEDLRDADRSLRCALNKDSSCWVGQPWGAYYVSYHSLQPRQRLLVVDPELTPSAASLLVHRTMVWPNRIAAALVVLAILLLILLLRFWWLVGPGGAGFLWVFSAATALSVMLIRAAVASDLTSRAARWAMARRGIPMSALVTREGVDTPKLREVLANLADEHRAAASVGAAAPRITEQDLLTLLWDLVSTDRSHVLGPWGRSTPTDLQIAYEVDQFAQSPVLKPLRRPALLRGQRTATTRVGASAPEPDCCSCACHQRASCRPATPAAASYSFKEHRP